MGPLKSETPTAVVPPAKSMATGLLYFTMLKHAAWLEAACSSMQSERDSYVVAPSNTTRSAVLKLVHGGC